MCFDLSLLVEWGVRSCVEPEILCQIEQEARLVTLLRVVSLPLVTCIPSDYVRLLVFEVRLDLHQDYVVFVLVFLYFAIHVCLVPFFVIFLLLDELAKTRLFRVLRTSREGEAFYWIDSFVKNQVFRQVEEKKGSKDFHVFALENIAFSEVRSKVHSLKLALFTPPPVRIAKDAKDLALKRVLNDAGVV